MSRRQLLYTLSPVETWILDHVPSGKDVSAEVLEEAARKEPRGLTRETMHEALRSLEANEFLRITPRQDGSVNLRRFDCNFPMTPEEEDLYQKKKLAEIEDALKGKPKP
jgi:hypothetical protein